jgi:biofilm PGA synthesis N-glycosyltransferase PgaC
MSERPLKLGHEAPDSRNEAGSRTGNAGEEAGRDAFYLPVTAKFLVSTFVAVTWFGVSLGLARPWLGDLSEVTGATPAFLIILFIALIPGFLNAHLLSSVLLDSPPPLRTDLEFPPISLLIAAYNEAENLPETFRGIALQDYPAGMEIIVVDDGSTDRTMEILGGGGLPNLKVVPARHGGKAQALNEGLKHVSNELVVCIDADTFLHPQALRRIVARLLTDPPHTAAVAGCVLVKNSRASFLARMQEWDYFTGIASAKRQQALYQGTLVAQGAFSVFRTAAVRACRGWPAVIGEDIVLTWALLKNDWRIGFEATAIGFTAAPTDLRSFLRQRKRWARGMIEGLRQYGSIAWKGTLASFFVGVDFILPAIDFFYAFAFIPGLVLALTGRFYIVGPMTVLVLPLAFLIVLIMHRKQKRAFDEVGLKVRHNPWGFLVYMLVYQALMSPVCVAGYFQEIVGMRKRW